MMLAKHFVGRCQLAEARMRHIGYLIRHMHTSHASTSPLSPAARHHELDMTSEDLVKTLSHNE